jgi:hypothetical protein
MSTQDPKVVNEMSMSLDGFVARTDSPRTCAMRSSSAANVTAV